MKKAGLVLLLLLLMGTAIAWQQYQSVPRIEFVEFRAVPEGRAAIFRLRNDSARNYLFVGENSSSPSYALKEGREILFWKSGRIDTGQTLLAHSSVEWPVLARSSAESHTFRVGVRLRREGAPLLDIHCSSGPWEVWFYRMRVVLAGGDPSITWSRRVIWDIHSNGLACR